MEISINQNVSFGMKPIKSLHKYAIENPNRVIKIDSDKLKKANKSIKMALKGAKIELQRARESASRIFLNV